jgi:hypothetical protein
MITTNAVYTTSDGLEFRSREDAEKHEAEYNIIITLENLNHAPGGVVLNKLITDHKHDLLTLLGIDKN